MKTSDRLRLLALVASLSLLSACGGGGGGGETKADLLTLSGKVIAPLTGEADVTVLVGTESFTTKTDGDGNFEIEIESADASALVTILSKLTGELSFAELAGNLGAFGDLATEAGDDDTLTSEENIRTNVTSLSTAEAVLLDEVEDGKKLLRAKEFSFGEGVDPDQALTLAAIIDLAIDDPDEFALPAGSATTLDLARSATARDAFRDDIEARAPEKLEQAKQDLVGNVEIVGPSTQTGTPPNLIAARLEVDGRYPLFALNLALAFDFAADGTALSINSQAGYPGTWERVENRVEVTLDPPALLINEIPVDCETGGGTRVETYTIDRFDLVPLSPKAVSVSYRETAEITECGQTTSTTSSVTIGYASIRPESLLPLTAAEFSGRSYALQVLDVANRQRLTFPLSADVLNFNANGTGNGSYIVGAFDWSVADNILTISYGDDVVGKYRLIRNVDALTRGFIADLRGSTAQATDLGIGILKDPQASFSANEIPARYYTFGIGDDLGNDPRLDGVRLRFDPDKLGVIEEDFIDGDEVGGIL